MTVDEVRAVMNRAVARLKRKDGPWYEHFTEMGKKTVLKRHSKVLPKSAEAAKAIEEDNVKEFGKPEFGLDIGDEDAEDLRRQALEAEREAMEEGDE